VTAGRTNSEIDDAAVDGLVARVVEVLLGPGGSPGVPSAGRHRRDV
jgi:hypothetical protein